MPLYHGGTLLDPKGMQRAYVGNTLVFDRGTGEPVPLPADVPARFDPNWDSVIYAMGSDQLPDGSSAFFGANRTNYPLALHSITTSTPVYDGVIRPNGWPSSLYSETVMGVDDPNSALQIGAGGVFTWEGWLYTGPINNSSRQMVAAYNAATTGDWTDLAFFFGLTGSSASRALAPAHRVAFGFSQDGTGGPNGQTGTSTWLFSEVQPENTWVYVAVCRDVDGNIRLFVNGAMVGKVLAPTFHVVADPLIVAMLNMRTYSGFSSTGRAQFADVRLSQAALYVSDAGHEMPTQPHPLGADRTGDPYFKNVTALWKCEEDPDRSNTRLMSSGRYGAGLAPAGLYYDLVRNPAANMFGIGALRKTSSNASAPATVTFAGNMKGLIPFTVECFAIIEAIATTRAGIVCLYRTSGSLRQWAFTLNSGKPEVLASAAGTAADIIATATNAVPLNQRIHLALTRDSNGIFRIFQDGIKVVESTILQGQNLFDAVAAGIGQTDVLTYNGAGFHGPSVWDEIRITRGVDRYGSGNFTPPTGPFPAHDYIAEQYNEPAPDPANAEVSVDRNYAEGSIVNLYQTERALVSYKYADGRDYTVGHEFFVSNIDHEAGATLIGVDGQFEGQRAVISGRNQFFGGERVKLKFMGYVTAGDGIREAQWEAV